MERNKILDRIQKLLRLANNNPSVEEAATAMSMALKLMRRHNIEEADLIQEDLRKKDSVIRQPVTVRPAYREQMAVWFNILVTGVGRTLDCHTAIYRDGAGLYMALHGYKADVEVANWLISYLHQQVEQLTVRAWKKEDARIRDSEYRPPYASERTRMKNAYRHGMVNAVLNRVTQVYGKTSPGEPTKTEQQTAQQNSLVVIKNSLILEQFPHLKEDYEETQSPTSAHSLQGRLDAAQVNVQRVLHENDEEEVLRIAAT